MDKLEIMAACQAVQELGFAVARSWNKSTKAAIKKERTAIARVLQMIIGRKATEEEIEASIAQ